MKGPCIRCVQSCCTFNKLGRENGIVKIEHPPSLGQRPLISLDSDLGFSLRGDPHRHPALIGGRT